jgi:signal transduction histidine kinase
MQNTSFPSPSTLAAHIHDHVVQRLHGVALVLAADEELSAELRELCHDELTAAMGELRAALRCSLEGLESPPLPAFEDEVRHILDAGTPLRVSGRGATRIPSSLEPLACSVLIEAVRNAHKHGHPSVVSVHVLAELDRFVMTVVNDGARLARPAEERGLGARLAALAALRHGGRLDHGPVGEDQWMMRLTVPSTSS